MFVALKIISADISSVFFEYFCVKFLFPQCVEEDYALHSFVHMVSICFGNTIAFLFVLEVLWIQGSILLFFT